MASPVDICNVALSHLGDAGNVASIDPPEASTQARFCARFYPVARDEVLESHTWRFNTRRKALASLSLPASVTGEWSYAYALPAGCLRPFAVYVPGVTEVGRTEDFSVETTDDGTPVLYTNVEGAYLKYVVSVTDTALFPPSVRALVAARLATYLALPLTRSADVQKAAEAIYLRAKASAEALDGDTQSTEEWRSEREPPWVAAR